MMSCSSEGAATKAAAQKPVLSRETIGDLLPQFSEAARRRLEAAIFGGRFDGVLQSEAVQDAIRLQGGGKTVEQLMVDMLPLARLYSIPPTSGYKVGAVCEGASGNIYFGANLELAGAPLGFTIHAEQSAIWNALAHGEKAVRRLAVTSAPCGHCRQFLNELTTASALEVIIMGKPKTTLGSLLPDSFGPADLGVKGGLLSQVEIPLVPVSAADDPLAKAALRAAGRSYSPYTQSFSGVAFQLKDQTIIVGSYVESAAYNPSLPPVVAAIDRLRFSGYQYSDISGALLVELENSKVSQLGMTRLIVHTVAPSVELRVLKARIVRQ
ncbi:MAG: cytidine deaminase [Candidatus Acidiferrales bacterium]